MRDAATRLQFALRFASMDRVLRSGTLKKVRQELEAFLSASGEADGFNVQATTVRPPYPWNYPKAELFRLQRDTRHLIEHAVEGHGLSPMTIGDQISLDVVDATSKGRTLRIGGSLRTVFLWTLALLLASEPGQRVRKCPECGMLFYRVRKQKYCTSKCTDRAVWRAYPASKKAAARRKQYDKYGWRLGARKKSS